MAKSTKPISTQLPALTEIQAERCRRDFHYFITQAWQHTESVPFVDGIHIQAISEHLSAVSKGKIRRLLITLPPRHGKSTLSSVLWNAWDWALDPSQQFLTSSYALSLAIRDSQKALQLINSQWYQSLFPYVKLDPSQAAKSNFRNLSGGSRVAVSVGSQATGWGGSRVCVDDPLNSRDADSPVLRQDALDWWTGTMSSRLNDPRSGAFVIIMQRLHENDLAGHVLREQGWDHLNLPAEYEGKKIFTSIGWSDPRTKEGQLLWPERIKKEDLDKIKKSLGGYNFSGQYQQRPVPAEGGQFKKQWIRYASKRNDENGNQIFTLFQQDGKYRDISSKDCTFYITVDLAVSLKETADYTVVACWAVTKQTETILVDLVRERLEIREQQTAVQTMFHKWPAQSVHVESVGYQLTMVQELLQRGIPVQPFLPKRDKVTRATTAAIRFEQGMFYLMRGESWLSDYEKELLSFPKDEHDDCVDVTSMIAEIVAAPVFQQVRSLEEEEVHSAEWHDEHTLEFGIVPPEPTGIRMIGYGPRKDQIEEIALRDWDAA